MWEQTKNPFTFDVGQQRFDDGVREMRSRHARGREATLALPAAE
jgi:hypothetical protein